MALTATQQAQELITRSKRILIATRDHAPTDALAAAVACGLYLKKQGKQVDIVVPGFESKKAPSFLRGTNDVRGKMGAMRAFHVTLDVSKTPLGELMYDVKDGKLEITVVPKEKEWMPSDVTFKNGEDRYDLVIALDCPDQASLGSLAREHAEFLYRTHVVNIDCSSTNEHWGQVNLVDLNAVSTTEVLFNLLESWNRNLIDEDLATALLAGMIARTRSFKTANVTPKTLATSSALIAMGARREEIVNGLWRTRSVATLKLWGRALARLEQDRDTGFVWTVLSHQDFIAAGADATALEDVIDELIGYAPEAKTIALIYEPNAGRGVCVTIAATAPRSAAELGRPLGLSGTRDRATGCLMDTTLLEASKTVIDRLRETLKATRA
ncbi:MAG TPA: DHH family phosphoesterase [Candidatus Methylomirabilis sp.]|nr:DHH family phosphoesterase [Candidatus Methylomirabilis sp.]